MSCMHCVTYFLVNDFKACHVLSYGTWKLITDRLSSEGRSVVAGKRGSEKHTRPRTSQIMRIFVA